jgi:hypothetical protein
VVIILEDGVGCTDTVHQLFDFHPVRASRHGGLSESGMSIDSVDAIDLYLSPSDSQYFVPSICECWTHRANIVRHQIGSSFVLASSSVCVCWSHHGNIVKHRSMLDILSSRLFVSVGVIMGILLSIDRC